MDWLIDWLDARRREGTLRRLRPIERLGKGRLRPAGAPPDSSPLLDFSSNDYLALSEHPQLISASRVALEKYGTGAGAARLMSGDLILFHALEEATARLKGKEAALMFGSGYMANTGVIPAVVGRGDVIFGDRLNHASIYDGCRLSGAAFKRFHHNDLNHLENLLRKERGQGRALIVVESVYSMDGDFCPLGELIELKERYGCLLMVDEAHATGVFGATGSGLLEEMGVTADVEIVMGTFGKALGSYGAYVAADRPVIDYLTNRARSFVYSTALPPAVAAASLAALELVQHQPQIRQDLQTKAALFKKLLKDRGVQDDLGPSQIMPLLVGKSQDAVRLADELLAHGIFATAVRPPTVPENTARIRFSITCHLSEQDLQTAAEVVVQCRNSMK